MVIRIGVLAFEGCTALTVIGPADVLRKASAIHADLYGKPAFEVLLVGVASRSVVTDSGMPLACHTTIDALEDPDLVIVPALEGDPWLRAQAEQGCIDWLLRQYRGQSELASFCTGSFVLASTGLLDGKRATTHWAFEQEFQRRFPAIDLQPEAIIVDEGRLITAGGATSFLNLALYVAEKHCGPETAQVTAGVLLIDRNKAPQSAYAIFSGQKAHGDAVILRAQVFIEEHAEQVQSIESLAATMAMSTRNFARRFKLATGNSPFEYVQRVRVEKAKRLLEREPDAAVGSVALQVGYDDIGSFRRIFERFTGLVPSEYRRRHAALRA